MHIFKKSLPWEPPSHPLGRFAPSHISSKPPVAPPKNFYSRTAPDEITLCISFYNMYSHCMILNLLIKLQCVPEKYRTLKQRDAATKFRGVWLSYIFHELWLICFRMIVEIHPVMRHWAALFSKLNVKIHLLHLWGCVFRFSYFLNVALIKNIHQNMR